MLKKYHMILQFLLVRIPGGLGWILCFEYHKTKIKTLAGIGFIWRLQKILYFQVYSDCRNNLFPCGVGPKSHSFASHQPGSTLCSLKLSVFLFTSSIFHIQNSNHTLSPSHTSNLFDSSFATAKSKLCFQVFI